MNTRIITAESVTVGHPDKFCDIVSDAVLDECLKQDKNARVACEVYATKGLIVVGGEITTTAAVDYKAAVQRVAEKVGYNLSGTELIVAVNEQSPDISGAVDGENDNGNQGAGDQGIMVGYAADDTLNFMPFCYEYARRLTDALTQNYKSGNIKGIGSDGKAQVSAEFRNRQMRRVTKIVVSVQHDESKNTAELRQEIIDKVIKPTFGEVDISRADILVNPSGRFVVGGIDADTGLTGRKLCVDAYGAGVRVGGGAYSGKDPSKVDRSAAYMARHIAKTIVASGYARECEVELAYAIGKAEPLSVSIDTKNTSGYSDEIAKKAVQKIFDLRPEKIAEYLKLKQPIYENTASGGHYGRDEFPWEDTSKIQEFLSEVESD
jgi:S-adenosylmethionine synthetase